MSRNPLPGRHVELRVTQIVIWRHGRTTWNADGRYQGQADPPLDRVGLEQSGQAAIHLAVNPPDLILTSDLLRATATADTLAAITAAPVKLEPRLREIDVGSWQGLTRPEVAQRYPEQYEAWLTGRPMLDRGGETKTQLEARVLAALRDIVVERVLLVTHGGTSRSVIDLLLDVPVSSRRWLAPLRNSHWSTLRRDTSGWRLLAHNVGPFADVPSTDPDGRGDDSGDADAVGDSAPRVGVDDDPGVKV